MNHQALSSFIWSVADLLRGDYKQSDYGKVILPFTVLRRLDCVLEPTKKKVLAELGAKQKAGLNPDPFLLRASGQSFYNTSSLDLGKLMGDQDHKSEINSLVLFKQDLGAFQRMYSFLSQIFDYGNTAIEKRFIFYRRLLPLLEFGREREGIDLSKVILTHHSLKDQGKRQLPLGGGEAPKLSPLTEAGSGSVQEKEKARLQEIIEKVNDLFEGDLTDDDQLIYVNDVIKGKLLECQELVVQASNNTKAQFANSPTLSKEIMNAVMDALAAHTTMSKQAIDSERVREGLKDVLLGPAQLYEALREKADQKAVEGA
jgi:type I restriction enzyme R subunit